MLDVGEIGLTGIPGDPAAIRVQAARMRAASQDAQLALTQIDSGRDTALADWRGAAADAFERHASRLRPRVADLIDLGGLAAPILEEYADILGAGQARYTTANAVSQERGRAAGAAEDGSAEQYEARKAAYDAQRDMQAAQIAVWEANRRAAERVAALTGRELPPQPNPYAYAAPPPPEPPQAPEGDQEKQYGLVEELTGIADAKRLLQGDWEAGIWLIAGLTPAGKAAKAAKLAKGAYFATKTGRRLDGYAGHLKRSDLEAAARELRGEVVARRADGTPFDHVKEVREAQGGLARYVLTLQRRVRDTRLSAEERAAVERELGDASRLLDYSERYVRREP